MAFSQTIFMASEGDAYVLVCAELLTGDLETEISLSVDVLDIETNTGTETLMHAYLSKHSFVLKFDDYDYIMCGGFIYYACSLSHIKNGPNTLVNITKAHYPCT